MSCYRVFRGVLVPVMAFGLSAVGRAQTPGARPQAVPGNCQQYVLAAYERFTRRYDFGGARPVAQVKMLLETTYQQPANRPRPQPTKRLIAAEREGDFLHFTDGHTEAYQSPGQLATIMRDRKIVAITTGAQPQQPSFAPGLQLLRTYVIEHAPVESCSTVKEANGRTCRRVVFRADKLSEKLPQLAGMQRLTVSIDEKTQSIFRFQVRYQPKQTLLDQVSYTLLEEAPTAGIRRLRPAFEYVLAAGVLRPEFAGFQLIDQRKR